MIEQLTRGMQELAPLVQKEIQELASPANLQGATDAVINATRGIGEETQPPVEDTTEQEVAEEEQVTLTKEAPPPGEVSLDVEVEEEDEYELINITTAEKQWKEKEAKSFRFIIQPDGTYRRGRTASDDTVYWDNIGKDIGVTRGTLDTITASGKDTVESIARDAGLSVEQVMDENPSLASLPVELSTYKIQKGDTLGGIAKQREMSLETLLELNPNLDVEAYIHPGQVLNMKASTTITEGVEVDIPTPPPTVLTPIDTAFTTALVKVPQAYKTQFTAVESSYNLPVGLLARMAWTESGFNPKAYNKGSKAAGLMQFIPSTAKEYKVDVTSPSSSIEGAGRYMQALIKRYKGDVTKAVAAYNWGLGNMDRKALPRAKKDGRGDPLSWLNYIPTETRNYVKKILGTSAPSLKEDKE